MQKLRKQTPWAFLALFWVIATSRWGSYFIKSPIFLSDILISMALISFYFKAISPKISKNAIKNSSLHRLFFVYIVLRLIFSDWGQPLITLRDFLPYFYLVLFFLSKADFKSTNKAIIFRYLLIAFVIHAVWFSTIVLFPSLINAMPYISNNPKVKIFSLRPDYDSAITSCLVAYILINIERFQHKIVAYFMTIFLVSIIFSSGSRAGFLSFALILPAVFLLRSNYLSTRSKRNLSIALPFFIISIIFLGLSNDHFSNRLIGTFGISTDENVQSNSANGTTVARVAAWKAVYEYVNKDPSQIIFGVGYGTDYLKSSNGVLLLTGIRSSGPEVPRSPHNYWLNTYARLGIIGLMFSILLYLNFIKIFWKLRPALICEPHLIFFSLIPLSLLAPATFGVVLESPFGAIPYFYSMGYIFHFYNFKNSNRAKL